MSARRRQTHRCERQVSVDDEADAECVVLPRRQVEAAFAHRPRRLTLVDLGSPRRRALVTDAREAAQIL